MAFAPFTPSDGPAWLPKFSSSIADLFRRIMPAPLRLKDYATADLPTAADYTQGLVYDSDVAGVKLSDGASWILLAKFTGDVAALENLATTGVAVRTGTSAWTTRTITGTASQITVTNGDGVSGNPTLSLPSAIVAPGSVTVTTDLVVNGNTTLGDAAGDTITVTGAPTFNAVSTFSINNGISISVAGTKTALGAWTVGGGVYLDIGSGTLTDTFSAASSTISNRYGSRLGTPTFAASNAITVTDGATLNIGGAPTAGTNVTITNRWSLLISSGNLNLATSDYYRGGTKVLGARVTGWGAMTGTAARTAGAVHTAQTISASPTQAQVQNIDDSLVRTSQRLKALIDDLITHGVIGA